MKEDRSNGHGLVDKGPRRETTLDMSAGRLAAFDPGAKLDRRKLTHRERNWIAESGRYAPAVNHDEEGE